MLDRLAAERDVIALDMPGFGASPPLADGAEPTPQGLAAGVGAFLDSLDVGTAHLVGNSLGAWVAIELAAAGVRGRSRTRAGGLLVAAAGAAARQSSRARSPGSRCRWCRSWRAARSGRRLALGGSVARPERVPAEAAARLVRDYARAPAFVRADHAMRSGLVGEMADLSVPVTLAWAEHDKLVRRPSRSVPGARMVDLPGCGHIPTWDDPSSSPAWCWRRAAEGESRRLS